MPFLLRARNLIEHTVHVVCPGGWLCLETLGASGAPQVVVGERVHTLPYTLTVVSLVRLQQMK